MNGKGARRMYITFHARCLHDVAAVRGVLVMQRLIDNWKSAYQKRSARFSDDDRAAQQRTKDAFKHMLSLSQTHTANKKCQNQTEKFL